jgi:hypothetical protein
MSDAPRLAPCAPVARRAGLVVVAIATLASAPAWAQATAGTRNGLPDRFQLDVGYFRLSPTTLLRFNPESGPASDVELERDLGFDDTANTFWVEGTWRLGRRHSLKLGFTRLSRDVLDRTIQRDFTWGGETYNAGLSATADSSSDLVGGYYRFALYRNERFEVGPTLGVGYLWLDARIRATGTVSGPAGDEGRSLDESASTSSVTGAIGGYAQSWPTKRLVVRTDFLYIKVSPGDSEAAVTDWRLGADYYFYRGLGLGLQYKFNRYSYDRGVVSRELGGEVTYKGFQVFLSALF